MSDVSFITPTAQPDASDNRRRKRFAPSDLSAEIMKLDFMAVFTSQYREVQIVDFNYHGCGVSCKKSYPLGSSVKIKIKATKDLSCEMHAIIRNKNEMKDGSFRYGCEFDITCGVPHQAEFSSAVMRLIESRVMHQQQMTEIPSTTTKALFGSLSTKKTG